MAPAIAAAPLRSEWLVASGLALLTTVGLLLTAGWGALEHLEAAYLFEAVKPSSIAGVIFGRQAAEQMHQPLFPLVLRLWAWLGGTGELWIRSPSAVFAGVMVLASWRFARSFLSPGRAVATAVLVAAAPLVAWYGRDASPYALLAMLGALSLWSAGDLLARGGRWPAIRTGLLLSLAFYTHFHGAWLVVIIGGWLLTGGRAAWRGFWTTTATVAIACLPAIGMLLDKLFVSVQGLAEDQPIMRYSHALGEAVPEALRILFGGEHFAFLATLAVVVLGAVKAPKAIRRLAVVAAGIAVLAELHITWQVARSKGIVYIDIRHYIFLVPLLAALVASAPRWAASVALAAALSTSVPMYLGSLEKPDARAALAYVSKYATGPEHAVAYLPAPWYSAIVEYYLLGVCPDLVHGRSFDGWWERGTCALYEKGAPNTVFGFPFGTERLWSSRDRRPLRWLWLVDLRDHRFGLPVAPSTVQEDFACWPGLSRAVVADKHFGPWVDVRLIDLETLRTLAPPPRTRARAVQTVRAAATWPIQCSE